MMARRELVLATSTEAGAGGNRATSAHEAPDLLFVRPEWHAHAACRGTMVDGKSLWFAGNTEYEKTREAKRVCATCPVRVPCAEAGGDEFGVWGEETRKQRARGRVDYRYSQRAEGGRYVKADKPC